MKNTYEINIKRLLSEIMYKSWLILLVTAVFATMGFVYAKKCLIPKYTASTLVYVNNYSDKVKSEALKINSSDIYTSQQLVPTYLQFLSSDKVLDAVSAKLNNKYTADELRGMMNASSLEETEVFSVSITASDPYEATEIANVLADMAPDVITEFLEGSSVKIVDYAKVPQSRSYPVYRKYIVVGGLAGGGLTTLIIILIFLFNSRISGEEDINKLFTAPVIGSIPNLDTIYGKPGYKYKYRYYESNRQKR